MELPGALGLFFLTAIAVTAAGITLAIAGDVIALRTGWGRLWVGSLLIAGATSLPELVTTVTAVRIEAPALAAGNVLGSNMANMSILALVVALLGERQLFQRLLPQQGLLAAFAIALTGMATLFAALRPEAEWLGVSLPAVALIGGYVVASRILHRYGAGIPDLEAPVASRSLRWGWIVFGISAAAIFVAAPFLAFSAQRIAELTGIAESFMGVLALAFVTSLPEMATTVTAFRMGAGDLAIAGIYGSNTFNIGILGVADLFYTQGSLFSNLDQSHVTAGLFALLLIGLGTVQLLLRWPLKRFYLIEPGSLGMVALYLLGIFLVFRMS
ncbi:MAG: hypothetical protein V3U90_05500 [Dehalococcoidia bacterium]